MKCIQKTGASASEETCPEDAVAQFVCWNTGRLMPSCEKHLQAAKTIAAVMCFPLTVTDLEGRVIR